MASVFGKTCCISGVVTRSNRFNVCVFLLAFALSVGFTPVVGQTNEDSLRTVISDNATQNAILQLLEILNNNKSDSQQNADPQSMVRILSLLTEAAAAENAIPNNITANDYKKGVFAGLFQSLLGEFSNRGPTSRAEFVKMLKILMNNFGILHYGTDGPVSEMDVLGATVAEWTAVSDVFSDHYNTSAKCSQHRDAVGQALLQNQYWALIFLDAMGKIDTGFYQGNTFVLGSFDQCQAVSGTGATPNGDVITGAFARLKFKAKVPGGAPPINGAVPYQQTGMPYLYWYLCVPSSCDDQDVQILGNEIAGRLEMQSVSADIARKPEPNGNTGFALTVALLSILAALCLLGTAIDVGRQRGEVYRDAICGSGNEWLFGEEKEEKEIINETPVQKSVPEKHYGSVMQHRNRDMNVTIMTLTKLEPETDASNQAMNGDSKTQNESARTKTVDEPKTPNVVLRFLLAFSLYTNVPDVLRAKHARGDITCLHGIRVISITWVILGHGLTVAPEFGNIMSVAEMTAWWTFQGFYNATYAVDTFFTLSGTLVCYLFLRETEKTGGIKPLQLVLYYVHRYLRLTPLFGMILLLYIFIYPYMEHGPFQGETQRERDTCGDLWWWNILYISNLRFESPMKWCYGVHWYLPNDMQFYWVAPLVIIPLTCRHRAIKALGFFVAFLLIACHMITTGILSPKYDGNLSDELAYIYFKPYSRCAPYAIGLIVGYILHKCKCKVRMPFWFALAGWMVAIATGLILVYIPYDGWKNGGIASDTWGSDEKYAYDTLKRPLWALAVSWVVFACATGYGGVVDSILSWQAWIPLSRLTYGTYLGHTLVHDVLNSNSRILAYYDLVYVVQRFLSVSILAFALSFVLSMLIETPIRNLIKVKKPSATTGKASNANRGQDNPAFSKEH